MERGGGSHHRLPYVSAAPPLEFVHPDESAGQSSLDNPATKKKPPKLKAINRSLSMAIDNYAPQMVIDDSLVVEQPLIHRAASPVPVRAAPPQSLPLPPHHQHQHQHQMHAAGAVSPALSARRQHHLHAFQQLAAQTGTVHRLQHQHQLQLQPQHQLQHPQHSSSASSPTTHSASPVGSVSASALAPHQHPDIYLVSSSSLGEGSGRGSTSPIQFIDDYMLPPPHRLGSGSGASATHSLKKTLFRRSDTIDVHPGSTFQMKKTHSFHAQQDPVADQLLLAATGGASGSTSRRTSSVRGNFLMPAQPGKDLSRSPSPSRRGCRSHRSFNDPARRPSSKPDAVAVAESQIRHPSLNDDLLEALEGRAPLFAPASLSLENELFLESRSRSNSHTRIDGASEADPGPPRAMRKSSGSFEEPVGGLAHAPGAASSLKKRDNPHPHPRQHSSHSLELDGLPSSSGAAATAASHAHAPHPLQLHSAAAAATAAYHFKRGAKHGHSLYLSPNNLEELQVHRPGLVVAAAAFQGTNASAKQAKAVHSASMRLRTYREALSASKKSKSFVGDSAYPPGTGNEFELTSPHRRNSRPLASAAGGPGGGAVSIEDIKRSPRPVAIASTSAAAAAAAFVEEKRPSFERKSSLTFELGDAAFEQVLRPFHHKVAGRKASMTGSHKALKKKSLSDETDEDEEADRKRKRIVCIVMTVFLCLVCASVFVVIVTLTHSSGQSQHSSKKIYTFTRETPVHYNVRQENERLMKESMERAKFAKNFTDAAALISAPLVSVLEPLP